MVTTAHKTDNLFKNSAPLWEGACFVINLAREKQRQTENKFVGPVFIGAKLKTEIRKFIRIDPIAKAICDSKDMKTAAERLIFRFEELCRRREISINSQTSRIYAYRQLLLDLHINTSSTGISPGKLVTTTLLNNELISALFEDRKLNKFLSSCPSFIEILAERNPSDLRKALSTAESRTQSILKDPAFKLFSSWPGVVRRIVLLRGNSYRDYLLEVQNMVESQLEKHSPRLNGKEATAIDLYTKFSPARAENEILKMLNK